MDIQINLFLIAIAKLFPEIIIRYEFDTELNMHWLWHNFADLDDSDEWNIFRLQEQYFHSINRYNIMCSYYA